MKAFAVAAGQPLSYTAKLRGGKYRFAVIALNALGAGPPSQQSRQVKAR